MIPFNKVAVGSIEPQNGADVWIKHSKNYLKSQMEQGDISYISGQDSDSSSRVRTQNYIPVKPNCIYTLNRLSSNGGTQIGIRGYDENYNYVGYIAAKTNKVITFKTITDSAGEMPINSKPFYYLRFIDLDNNKNAQYMLSEGEESLEYEEISEDDILLKTQNGFESIFGRFLKNNYGEYLKLKNGIMICQNTKEFENVSSGNVLGSLYRSNSLTFDKFPYKFIDVPIVYYEIVEFSEIGWIASLPGAEYMQTAERPGRPVIVKASNNIIDNIKIRYLAIGKWK